jgi:hypothetical protein
MANGEPDSGVSGDNLDLGRFFELFIRGQAAQQRVLNDLRSSAQQSLHMAQTFATGPGVAAQAAQARQNLGGGFQAGQTTNQSMGGAGAWSVSGQGIVTPPVGGQNVISGVVLPPGPPAGSTTGRGPSTAPPSGPTPGMTTIQNLIQTHTRFPMTAAGWGTTFSTLGNQTTQQVHQSLSRAALGVWSPFWRAGQGGGNQGGGGGNGGGNGNGGQLGSGPYGMGPAGMPPNPIYFGGNGSPLGPYGPYGPYGAAGAGPGGGGGHGGGGGGGVGGYGAGGGGSHSGGGGGGVMGWLGRNIPGASLVTGGIGEMRNQRDKNAYYQNVEGGSNFSGFAERGHEEAYALSAQSIFSGDEARTAFKGVTRLGYNNRVDDAFSSQGGRQDALDFAYHAKSSYGASVNESLSTLEKASKNSTVNLNELNKALKDISDTAGSAGVNAQMARSQLMSLMQTGLQAGYGAGSVPTAANLQMGKTSLGRSYESIDLSGQMSQQYTYMASSNAGMTYNQYTAMQTTNPLAASQARAGENLALLSQIFTQDEIDWVNAKAKSLGGKLDPNSALSIVPAFLQAFPNHNLSVIQQQLSAFGIVTSSDPTEALGYAFNLIAGNNGDLANAQKNSSSTSPMSSSAAKTASKDSSSGLYQNFSTKVDTGSSTAAKIGGSLLEAATAGLVGDVGTDKGDSKALQAYKKSVDQKSGQRNPVLENLLQSVSDPDKAKVLVHTSTGERVMSLSDAIKNHPNELSSGSVEFVSGDEKGKTVQDLLGTGSVNTSADWTTEASKSSGKTGQSLSDWEKKNPDDASTFGTGTSTGSNGQVVVDLTDAAKQLLKISSATGIAGANGEAAPPLNSYNYNASR